MVTRRDAWRQYYCAALTGRCCNKTPGQARQEGFEFATACCDCEEELYGPFAVENANDMLEVALREIDEIRSENQQVARMETSGHYRAGFHDALDEVENLIRGMLGVDPLSVAELVARDNKKREA